MNTMTSVQRSGLQLGPRTRSFIRFVATFVNPVVMLIAGRRWMPVVGILRHRGRRSGRSYASPLGMRPDGDSFVMPLTFSVSAAWYRNVLASGSASVTYLGRTYMVRDPEVIDYETARRAFPRYERLQFRVLGINQYLRLRQVQAESTTPRSPNLGLALGVIALAQLMVVLDVAVVNVALPSIQKALHFDPTNLEWVVNAYSIAFGGLLLLGGRMGDLFGRRRMFVLGVLLFTAGSLAGGLATTSTAPSRAPAVRSSPRRRFRSWPAPSKRAVSASAPWASTPRSPQVVARSACCSAASSRTTSRGGGSCSSTFRSGSRWRLPRRVS